MHVYFRVTQSEADRDNPTVNNNFEAFRCDTITCQGLKERPQFLAAVRLLIWNSDLFAWVQLDDDSLNECTRQDHEKITLLIHKADGASTSAAQHKPVGEATLDTRIERLEQSLKAQLQQEREERQQERQQLLAEINKLQDEQNGVYTGHLKVH